MSSRLGADDQGWSIAGQVLGGRTIERSGDAICGLHRVKGDEEREFLGSTSKARSTVFLSLTSKSMAAILMVWPQNHSLRFSGLCLKTGSCGLVIYFIKSP
jgi:hypothetical protein